MKKLFMLLTICATIMFCNSVASANERLIEASGSYIMDSRLDETPASATARAREEAKRAAAEKAGVYLESYSKTINLELAVDEVKTVAARLLKIQEESNSVTVVENSLLKFTVNIKAVVDELNEADLKAMMSDKQALEDLARKNKELQEKYDELNRQMEQYRRDFDTANDAQKLEIKKDVKRNSEKFSAVDELAKGNDFAFRKDYSQALVAYTNAINLDSKLAEAYNNRGIVNYELGKYSEALADYSQAINLKSNYADAYNNRGNVNAALNQFQNAEKDLKAALKINPNSAVIHNNLGSVFLSLKNIDEAIDEYSRAIEINPRYADARFNRAAAYYIKGNIVQSFLDITEARNLNPADKAIIDLYEKLSKKY